MIEKLSVGMWRMYIHTPGWHTFYFITFSIVSHLVAQVAFQAEVAFWVEVLPVWVEVCRFLCSSSVSAESVLCNFGLEGSCPYVYSKTIAGCLSIAAFTLLCSRN
jgi:hypothetical protein